jgi:hypothetical protein
MAQPSMRVIYRLKDDRQHVENVKKTTLTTKEFGIEQTHGVFGSPEWWAKISSGELPIHTSKGTITRRYMASMNDWPEFTMVDDSGRESNWNRYGNSGEDDRYYQPGRRIEIDYVWQQIRLKGFSKGAEHQVVVEVRIEATSETIREQIIRRRARGKC